MGGIGSLPGTYKGLNPFVTNAVAITPTSCAKSVTFELVIADVCQLTNISGFNNKTLNVWIDPVGSNYDGTPNTNDGYASPATLTVVRNTTGTPATLTSAAVAANPLPASCGGAGVDVLATPSANQINNDLPVVINGAQAWPLP